MTFIGFFNKRFGKVLAKRCIEIKFKIDKYVKGPIMPYRTTKVYVKPTPETQFHNRGLFQDTSEEGISIGEQWKALNIEYEMFSRRTFNQLDENTLEVAVVWDSKEQCEEYRNNPAVIAHSARIDRYNIDNGITVTSTEEEI